MSSYKYWQINIRLDKTDYDKLKALSDADSRSMASYTRLIIEDFLKGKYFPRKRKQRNNYESQAK